MKNGNESKTKVNAEKIKINKNRKKENLRKKTNTGMKVRQRK